MTIMPVLNEQDARMQKIPDSEIVSGEFLNASLGCFYQNITEKQEVNNLIPCIESLEDGKKVDIDELISDLHGNEKWAGKNGHLELQDNLQNAIMVIAAMRYELSKRDGGDDYADNT
jgi:hypothetical protein